MSLSPSLFVIAVTHTSHGYLKIPEVISLQKSSLPQVWHCQLAPQGFFSLPLPTLAFVALVCDSGFCRTSVREYGDCYMLLWLDQCLHVKVLSMQKLVALLILISFNFNFSEIFFFLFQFF